MYFVVFRLSGNFDIISQLPDFVNNFFNFFLLRLGTHRSARDILPDGLTIVNIFLLFLQNLPARLCFSSFWSSDSREHCYIFQGLSILRLPHMVGREIGLKNHIYILSFISKIMYITFNYVCICPYPCINQIISLFSYPLAP